MLGNLMDLLTTRLMEVISELAQLLLPGLCGMFPLRPSFAAPQRSKFHGSKFDGGRNGGMTAFSFSMGKRASGAPFLSIVVMRKSSLPLPVPFKPQSLLLLLHAVQTSVFGTPAGGAAAALDSSAFMVASRGTSSGNGASRLVESPCLSVCVSLSLRKRLDMRFHQDCRRKKT